MKRKFYMDLKQWAEKTPELPLMVTGARQTGKTYLIRQFCEENFSQHIYINFDIDRQIRDVFEKTLQPDEILRQIELRRNERIDVHRAVLFFDEVQASERAIASLKYFAESPLPYRIICAGSLLGVKLNRFRSSFPVGKVILRHMYPMDFEEFLWALGKEMWAEEIRARCGTLTPIGIHEELLELYRKYLCIGGMPACAAYFLQEGEDVLRYDNTLIGSIVASYLADMGKYTSSNAETVKIEAVFNSLPAQLAKEDRKFRYRAVAEGGNKNKYESAIEWLSAAGMVYRSRLLTKPEAPLTPYESETAFKLYYGDVGILTFASGLLYRDILLDTNMAFKGALAENFIASALTANGVALRYWASGNRAEVDFILYNGDGVIPIEVKAGFNTQSKSLRVFMEKYAPPYGIRFSAKNFAFEGGVKSLPLYAAFCV